MTRAVIFAPSPVLTVTIEEHPDGPDVHLHAGGQGVWQARMLQRMGVSVTMCSVLSGESGRMLRHLLRDEGITVVAVDREARGGVYVHDRRGGEREPIVETGGQALSRHDLDELYGLTLREGLEADIVILSGPASDDALPDDVYRRLAADLRNAGRRVMVDLAGERLKAAVAGGVTVVKVSDEELLDGGFITKPTTENIITAMRALLEEGCGSVVVTRADKPLLVVTEDEMLEVTMPTMEVADHRGAGDSLTAGVAAALARGDSMREAITLGAAAGALNVTRHGLGTGDPEAIERLRGLVTTKSISPSGESVTSLSPDQLAAMVEEEDEDENDSAKADE